MRRFHLVAFLVAAISATALIAMSAGPASACPGGYVRCGGACCPGR